MRHLISVLLLLFACTAEALAQDASAYPVFNFPHSIEEDSERLEVLHLGVEVEAEQLSSLEVEALTTKLYFGVEVQEHDVETPIVVEVTEEVTGCPLNLPDKFSNTEQYVWSRVCVGWVAAPRNFEEDDDKTCLDTLVNKEWVDLAEHTLSYDFINLILYDPTYVSARGNRTIRIECAYVPWVDVSGLTIATGVSFKHSLFESINLADARFNGPVSFEASQVRGNFNASRITVDGRLSLWKSTIERNINLTRAHINGALRTSSVIVKGDYDAVDARVFGRLISNGIRVEGNTDISYARVSGNAQFGTGSIFLGDLEADFLRAEGWIYFGHNTEVFGSFSATQVESFGVQLGPKSTYHGEVDLREARSKVISANEIDVRGGFFLRGSDLSSLSIERSSFAGIFNAHSSNIREVFASNAHFESKVFFNEARIENSLNLAGVDFENVSNFRGLDAGTLDLSNSTLKKDLDLDIANVDTLHLDRSIFHGRINARTSKFHSVSATGANFKETFDINSSDIDTLLNLRNAYFEKSAYLVGLKADALILGNACSEQVAYCGEIKWGPESSLHLNSSSISTLYFDLVSSFKRIDDTWLPVGWNGANYGAIIPTRLDNDLNKEVIRYDVATLIDILEGTMSADLGDQQAVFRPQPYRALETALSSVGAETGVKQVAFARLLHRSETRPHTFWGWFSWIADMILWPTVGLGVYPELASIYFFILVGIGTIFARSSHELCVNKKLEKSHWGDSFFYSLQNSIPLMQPSSDYVRIEHRDNDRLRWFFSAQKIVGFFLATIIIGSLTLGS